MRVLLDQNLPRGLRRNMPGIDVRTAFHMGWADLGNGELLRAAEQAGFTVLVTADQNLRYQQNLDGRPLSVVVLSSNRWDAIKGSTGIVLRAVMQAEASPGSVVEVAI